MDDLYDTLWVQPYRSIAGALSGEPVDQIYHMGGTDQHRPAPSAQSFAERSHAQVYHRDGGRRDCAAGPGNARPQSGGAVMLMLHLLLAAFAGGALAWWSESRNPNAPRWISLAVLAVATIYMLSAVAAIPAEQLSLVPRPDNPQTWLMHYRAEWISAFWYQL